MIVGIDLSSQPAQTGVAWLREDLVEGVLVIEDVVVGAADVDVVAAVENATSCGVDAPFGWPAPFADFVAAHRTDSVDSGSAVGPHWRRPLTLRSTDVQVRERTGLTPLSVTTDRIAYPALRWAGLAAQLSNGGTNVARDGSGSVCEVYPAAALRIWDLPHRGYKRAANRGAREELIHHLTILMPWLEWNTYRDACAEDDDALDAVLCAVIAREVGAGRYQPPSKEQAPLAAEEGWICLPVGPPVRPGSA